MMRIRECKWGEVGRKTLGRDSFLFDGAWWGRHLCYFCKAVATLQRKLDRTKLVGEAICGIFTCETEHE